MARIAGVEIPHQKRIIIALTYIYGIGLPSSKKILKELNIDENIRVKNLNEEQISIIRSGISKLSVEGVLRREISLSIKRLMEIGCYRGIRHRKGLTVRGQNTRNNAKTAKKSRKKPAVNMNLNKKNSQNLRKKGI